MNEKYLGQIVKVKMDRPLGTKHPKHGFVYEVNYGYIPGIVSGDKNIYNDLIFVMPSVNYHQVYEAVGEPSKDIDNIKEYQNHIFWSFDLKNYKKSNWWIKTAKANIKDKITIRTANTIKKVLELSKQ